MFKSRTLKRIFWILVFSSISALILAFSLIYLYEEDIKSYTIKRINSSINARIDVDKIDLSFFSQFPKASLDFHNVNFYEKGDNKPLIVKSEKIYLSFDVFELLQNNYHIEDIIIKDAVVNFDIYKNGQNNFSFLISKNKSDSSSFLLNLSAIKFINTIFNYSNKATNQKFQIAINKATAKGVFSAENSKIELKGKTILKNFYNNSRLIISNKSIELDVITKLNTKSDNYTLNKGVLIFDNIPLKLNGNIQVYKNSIGLNASLNAKMLNSKSIIKNLDSDIRDLINKYNLTGLLSIDINIKGRIGGKYRPHIKASASFDRFNISNKELGVNAKNISLKLKYNNGKKNSLKTSSIIITKLEGQSNIGDFKGNIEIKNLWQPKLTAVIDGKWNLNILNNVLDIDTLASIEGKANTHTKLNISFKYSEKDKKWSISKTKFDSDFNIINGSLSLKDSEISYSNINSKGRIENNKILIYKLKAQTATTNISILGSLYNLPYSELYNSNKAVVISLSLSANKLSYKTIMQALPASSNNSDSRFSDKLDIVIDIKTDEFIYDNITAKNVSGRFQMRNRRLSFFSIKANTLGGSINGMMWIDGSKSGHYDLFSKGITSNIDINNTFSTFKNFGQETITSSNISGKLDSKYELKLSLDDKWNIISNSIFLNSDMLIKNGVLKNVSALNALKSYTKIDDFSELKFSELSNNITVSKSQLIIPQMEVNSNKMNIKLSGTHNFDNSYEYHFTILLSDVMGKKYNQTLKNEFGEIENDGLGRTKLFLTLKGKSTDFDVSYDKSELRKKIKEDLQEEKSSLKDALNKEFGWFKDEAKKSKKDSLKIPKKTQEKENIKKQEEGEFIIEWDDE